MYQLPAAPITAALPVPLEDSEQALNRTLKLGLIAVAALVVALIAMGALIQTSGAVIGTGKLSAEAGIKQVAHPSGGVVAELYVKEGDRVRQGQPIMRFDSTVEGVSASALGQSVEQLLAAQARLIAERDGLSQITFPPMLTDNKSPSAVAAMTEARRQFAVRRDLLSAELGGYRERVNQAEQEIGAIAAQRQSAVKQATLINPELNAVRDLYARKLVTVTRLNQMERTAAELRGASSAYGSNIAQTRARIAELRQMAISAERTFRSNAAQELAGVNGQLNDQTIRSTAAADASQRSVLRAPFSGIIDKLKYATVGGVVPAAQTIMEIVPDDGPLVVEVAISPNDLDQVHVGQKAVVRFSGLSATTTPELDGSVTRVGAERSIDPATGVPFIAVRVSIAPGQLAKIGAGKLRAGMAAETFIGTSDRSLLSYLTKPLIDQFARAFRET